jgi:hypothetical protein
VGFFNSLGVGPVKSSHYLIAEFLQLRRVPVDFKMMGWMQVY